MKDLDSLRQEREKRGKKLGEILIEQGIITPQQLRIALEEQKRTKEKLGQVLERLGLVTREELVRALGDQAGIPYVDLAKVHVDPQVLDLVPEEVARALKVLPIGLKDSILLVVMSDPHDIRVIDQLRRLTGLGIEPMVAEEERILRAIDAYYKTAVADEERLEEVIKEALLEKESKETTPPIVRIVNSILVRALREGATDIHIEPQEKVIRVRYRIDGILHLGLTLPLKIYSPVLTRIKVMADLDITETRIPQDGGFRFDFGVKTVDLRVSTYPTVFGESVVIRVLEKSSILIGLDQLGFSEENLRTIRSLTDKPYGIFVVTGPTGSGKTTTLYALLLEMDALHKSIMTVEDPVEYRIPFIKQSQVNERAGFTFARALRAILRHDPDVILVGEMRDQETAEMAFRAAMTGHLVLTTLHANTAPAAIPRLLNMGIDPNIVATSLLAVQAQRLVRRICDGCRVPYRPSEEELLRFGVPHLAGKTLYRGEGCEKCKGTGYKGRTGIHEILVITPEVGALIARGATAQEIQKAAGLKTMREDGIEKALKGITTLEEVVRVVG